MPPGPVGGWDLGRVDEGLTVDGVGEVLHAVVAHALGEPEGGRLLLRAPLSAQRARWLQVLARVDGLLPHRGAHDRSRRRTRPSRPGPGSAGRRAPACTRRTSPPCPDRWLAVGAGAVAAGLGGAFEPQPAPIRATQGERGQRSVVWSSLLHPWIVGGVGVHGRAAVIDGLRAQFVVPGLVAVDLAQPVRGAVLGQPRGGAGGPDVDRVPRHVSRRARGWPPIGRPPLPSRTSRSPRGGVAPGTPGNASRCRRRTATPSSAASVAARRRAPTERWIEVGDTRNLVVEDRRAVGNGTAGLAKRTTVLVA